MSVEKPCSPGHCLKLLNDNMRTDILRRVHACIQARMDLGDNKSPLKILIESLEEVIEACADLNRFEGIERNPFNMEPGYRFDPASDYQHDMQLLTSQLGSLQEIEASLGNTDIA